MSIDSNEEVDFANKLIRLQNLLESFVDIDLEAVNRLNTKIGSDKLNLENGEDVLGFTYLHFINSITTNTDATRVLSMQLSVNFNLEHSVGLILRNSIGLSLDIFYITYLVSLHDTERLFQNLSSFHSDNLNHLKGHYRRMKESGHPSAKNVSLDEFLGKVMSNASGLKTIVEKFSIKSVKYPKKSEIFTILKEQTDMQEDDKFGILKQLAGIYDVWTYYSKYEHLTILTHEMKNKSSKLMHLNRIVDCHELLTYSMEFLCMPFDIKTTKQKYADLRQQIVNIHYKNTV